MYCTFFIACMKLKEAVRKIKRPKDSGERGKDLN